MTEQKSRGNPFSPPPRPKVMASTAPVENPNNVSFKLRKMLSREVNCVPTDVISIPIGHFIKNDVLSGRGGGVNGHPGNKRYRTFVNPMKAEYLSPRTRKSQKIHIAANIVWAIRQSNPPGRFLKVDVSSGIWHEIGDKAAFQKTGQALRENSSVFRTCWREMLAEDARSAHEGKETTRSGV